MEELFICIFRNVLVKGGDLPASLDAVDIFFDGIDSLNTLYYVSS